MHSLDSGRGWFRMGYVGRSGWRNAIWGSTTERVVRHTAQAVLVIKGEPSGVDC